MLFLYGERLFNIDPPENGCEDMGIEQMRISLADAWFYQWLIWIPFAFAISSIDQIAYHISRREINMLSNANGVTVWIVFGWVFFTLMSLLTLLLFGRAPISYTMKFVHVGFELMHLIKFFLQWGWSGHVTMISTLALFSFFSSLNMPCTVQHALTALGAVLDTANFLICTIVPQKSFPFKLLTIAFFLHASYIWTFLIMVALGDPFLILLLRSYGVYANSAAIFMGCWSILASLIHDEYGSIKKFTTLIVRKSSESMVAIGKSNVFVLYDKKQSNLLIPSTDTYFPDNIQNTIFMHLLCMIGNIARVENDKVKWLDFDEHNIDYISTSQITVKRPTHSLLWIYKIVNWGLFITFMHALTEVSPFLPSLIMSWIPLTFIIFIVIITFRYCA